MGEVLRHALESCALHVQNLNRFRQRCRCVLAEPGNRKTYGGERILQFVRDVPGGVAEGSQPLHLELALAAGSQINCHFPHSLAKDLELRRTTPRRRYGQRIAFRNAVCPSNQVVERSGEVSAQVARHARCANYEEREKEKCQYSGYRNGA